MALFGCIFHIWIFCYIFLCQVSYILPLQHFKLSSALLSGILPVLHVLIWPVNKKCWLHVWPLLLASVWTLQNTSQLLVCQTNDCGPLQTFCGNLRFFRCTSLTKFCSIEFQNLNGRKGSEQTDSNTPLYSDT